MTKQTSLEPGKLQFDLTSFFLVRGAAEHFIRRSKEAESTTYEHLAALSFGAFALEGYLNMVGTHHVGCWSEIEKGINPENKLALLSEVAGLATDMSRRPFQSFRDIFKYRNVFSHPKLEKRGLSLKPNKDGKVIFDGWVGVLQTRAGPQLAEDALAMIDAIEAQLPEPAQVLRHERAPNTK